MTIKRTIVRNNGIALAGIFVVSLLIFAVLGTLVLLDNAGRNLDPLIVFVFIPFGLLAPLWYVVYGWFFLKPARTKNYLSVVAVPLFTTIVFGIAHLMRALSGSEVTERASDIYGWIYHGLMGYVGTLVLGNETRYLPQYDVTVHINEPIVVVGWVAAGLMPALLMLLGMHLRTPNKSKERIKEEVDSLRFKMAKRIEP